MPAPADWTRADWAAFADRVLAGAMAHASSGRGRITPPGAEGGYGHDVDGLEGFARTFLLAGFRIAGERGIGVDHLIEFFSQGIRTGVDPDAPDRWVRLDEHDQAKVEAASLALILDMTRPWIWDRLDALTQQRVIDYLAPAVGDDTYPRTNWLWFRLVVQTFLRSVDGPWSPDDVAADLALHDSFAREGGWMSDGEERSYDHYVGWALHLYPVLWARMAGAEELAVGRTARDVAALDRYLQDAIHLVGADGSPLIQGRSLIYRFAAAAPFWVGALAGVPSVSAGALRRAANRIVTHFDDNGALRDGVLSMGWHGEWRPLAQSYSGPGSPYWATKGLLGLALPADHPVWQAEAEPLPAERGDFARAIAAPGWAVTSADGIVRIANHGTDHAAAGSLVADSPLYARIAYSTATSPLLDERGWREPLEQSIALIGPDGRATHRAAMELIGVDTIGDAATGSSTWRAHTIAFDEDQVRHGSGLAGDAVVVARVTACSIARGTHEIRLARVDGAPAGTRIRWGGWPVASARVDADGSLATANGLTSRIRALGFTAESRVERRADASPLGESAGVPVVEAPVADGRWQAVEIVLTTGTPADARVEIGEQTATVTWPDGATTTAPLPLIP
ncbi:MAG: DUF2264 domain-containing protein [Candidatus Microbacterium stercoravium]